MSRQKLLNIQLVAFLFKTASEVVCGEKYPTVSLVLLFRAEIEHALEITPTVRELKENMQRSLIIG